MFNPICSRTAAAAVVLLASTLPARIAMAADAPPATGIGAIHAYAGTWKIEIYHLDTPYSKAGHDSSTLHNDCWESGPYLACRQIVDGDSKVLLVFTCNGDHDCTSYQIPPHGADPGAGKLTLDGKTWTFPWQITESGKTTWFRVVNVWSSPTTIEYRQEYSTNQTHWTPTATGHETKIAQP